jgi:hypothetical protein
VNQDSPNLEVVRKLIKIFPAGAGMPSLSGNLPLHYCVSRARCACYSVVHCSCVRMVIARHGTRWPVCDFIPRGLAKSFVRPVCLYRC